MYVFVKLMYNPNFTDLVLKYATSQSNGRYLPTTFVNPLYSTPTRHVTMTYPLYYQVGVRAYSVRNLGKPLGLTLYI